MMDGECSISKAGRDEIYCYGSTTANHDVDKLAVVVYVDRYHEAEGDEEAYWGQIDCGLKKLRILILWLLVNQ